MAFQRHKALNLTLTLTLDTQIPKMWSNSKGVQEVGRREDELPEDIALLAQRNKKNSKRRLQIKKSQNILRGIKSFSEDPL